METLVLGLDSATWERLNRLVDDGHLPTFDRLLDGGVRGHLESTTPPMTPLAWPSMLTGVNPGKHGLFDFFELDRSTYELSTTDIGGLDCPAVWDIFETEGIRAGFFNVPVAYPPPDAGAFFSSGIPADLDGGAARPPEFETRLREAGFEIQPDVTADDGLERYFEAVRDHTETQGAVLASLLDDYDLDHLWTVFMGLDWAQHYLWETEIDGENAVDSLYRDVDRIVGELLDRIDDDVTVLVVSDHGARRIDGEVHLNSLLEDWGYLTSADGGTAGFTESIHDALVGLGWTVGRSLPRSIRSAIKRTIPNSAMDDIETVVGVGHETMVDDIDWANTRAFAYGYMGRVFVHLADEYADGSVETDVAESLRSELATKFESLEHPDTGDSLVETVLRPEDVYEGPYARSGADLIVVPRDWRYMFYGDFDDEWFQPPTKRLADHDPNGVLVVSGPEQDAADVDAHVTDIAPTLLALHGLPSIESMDGSVIEAVAGERERAPVSGDKYLAQSRDDGRSDSDERAARERLEDLGYI